MVASCLLALACGGQTDDDRDAARGGAPSRGGGGGSGGSSYVPPVNDGCFAKGTRVSIATGSVAIEDVNVGDRVLGYDFATERVVDALVTEVFVHGEQQLGLLQTSAGPLRVTANHPVYDVSTQSFVMAGDRREPFVALELASNWSTTPGSLAGFRALPEVEKVYNLTVEGVHNYFAGGVLVHNKPRCGYPGDPPDCPCIPGEHGCSPPPGFAGMSTGGGAGVGGVSAVEGGEAGQAGTGGEPAAAGAGGETQ